MIDRPRADTTSTSGSGLGVIGAGGHEADASCDGGAHLADLTPQALDVPHKAGNDVTPAQQPYSSDASSAARRWRRTRAEGCAQLLRGRSQRARRGRRGAQVRACELAVVDGQALREREGLARSTPVVGSQCRRKALQSRRLGGDGALLAAQVCMAGSGGRASARSICARASNGGAQGA